MIRIIYKLQIKPISLTYYIKKKNTLQMKRIFYCNTLIPKSTIIHIHQLIHCLYLSQKIVKVRLIGWSILSKSRTFYTSIKVRSFNKLHLIPLFYNTYEMISAITSLKYHLKGKYPIDLDLSSRFLGIQ